MSQNERLRDYRTEVLDMGYGEPWPKRWDKIPFRKRFAMKIRFLDNGCWEWTGPKAGGRYGVIINEFGEQEGAHRASYRIFIGEIPDGLCIDHLCRKIDCVNPNHLEAVTIKENTHRGNSPSIVRRRTGFCVNGHPMTPENKFSTGKTGCKACAREYAKLVREKKRRFIPAFQLESEAA